ncbi:MAG: hypothetical protein JJV88_03650, partial [Sulfurovum sp.]|nr:hypothetical protein [Sulfurovaceae bacterium]
MKDVNSKHRMIASLKQQQEAEKASTQALKQRLGVFSKSEIIEQKYKVLQQQIATALRRGTITTDEATNATRRLNRARREELISTRDNNTARGNAINGMVRHIRQMETMVFLVYGLTRAYQSTLGVGVELNKIIENNSYGLAALIASNTNLVDSQGEVQSSSNKFRESLALSQRTMLDIRSAAKETSATFPELTAVFQQAIGFAFKMDKGFGNSTQGIIDNTIKIISSLTNMGSSIGMSAELMLEETRSLFSGDVSRDSKLAILLFGTPSAANKAMKDARHNVNGVFNLLQEKLKMFENLKYIDTYQRAMDKLKAGYQEMMMTASEPLFQDIKTAAKTLLNELERVREVNGEMVTGADKYAATVKNTYNYIKENFGLVIAISKTYLAIKATQIAWNVTSAVGLSMIAAYNVTSKAILATKAIYLSYQAIGLARQAGGNGLAQRALFLETARNRVLRARMLLNPATAILGALTIGAGYLLSQTGLIDGLTDSYVSLTDSAVYSAESEAEDRKNKLASVESQMEQLRISSQLLDSYEKRDDALKKSGKLTEIQINQTKNLSDAVAKLNRELAGTVPLQMKVRENRRDQISDLQKQIIELSNNEPITMSEYQSKTKNNTDKLHTGDMTSEEYKEQSVFLSHQLLGYNKLLNLKKKLNKLSIEQGKDDFFLEGIASRELFDELMQKLRKSRKTEYDKFSSEIKILNSITEIGKAEEERQASLTESKRKYIKIFQKQFNMEFQ